MYFNNTKPNFNTSKCYLCYKIDGFRCSYLSFKSTFATQFSRALRTRESSLFMISYSMRDFQRHYQCLQLFSVTLSVTRLSYRDGNRIIRFGIKKLYTQFKFHQTTKGFKTSRNCLNFVNYGSFGSWSPRRMMPKLFRRLSLHLPDLHQICKDDWTLGKTNLFQQIGNQDVHRLRNILPIIGRESVS